MASRELTIKQVAVKAQCHPDTVRRWIRRGVFNRITYDQIRLNCTMRGGIKVVTEADFDEFCRRINSVSPSCDAIKCHNCGAIIDLAATRGAQEEGQE